MTVQLDFIHRFTPAPDVADAPTVLLLHGTGGNEDDLLPVGRMLAPEANLLSPRGKVLEGSMPRFFRRLAEGVFDEQDIVDNSLALAQFVRSAADVYGFDAQRVFAVGYSNGANMAAALMLLYPKLLSGAALFRSMLPLAPPALPDLTGVPAWLSAGQHDSIIPGHSVQKLADLLEEAGAAITLRWQNADHGLIRPELAEATTWLTQVLNTRSS